MKKCSSCNIKYNTSSKYCPLCQNVLVGTDEESMFPRNIRLKTNTLIFKILLFISISTFLIAAFIEYTFTNRLHISLYYGFCLVNNYIIMKIILNNYQNVLKMCGKYGFIVVILLVLWFLITKSKIITNYIIPSVCIFELLFNLITGMVLKKKYFLSYLNLVVMNLGLLLLPMVFVLFHLTSNNIMSYICALLCIISIVGLLIFFYDDITEELSKLFNL